MVFEQSWKTVSDVDLYLRDMNCGSGSSQLGADGSRDTKSMVRLRNSAAGEAAEPPVPTRLVASARAHHQMQRTIPAPAITASLVTSGALISSAVATISRSAGSEWMASPKVAAVSATPESIGKTRSRSSPAWSVSRPTRSRHVYPR